jgi:predicted TIM-barrel fold metal-dependent hydrolase
MSALLATGVIDCDLHPAVPTIKALLPYMEEHWQDAFTARGIDHFNPMSYPPNAPLTCRPDWREPGVIPGSNFSALQKNALDAFGARYAICNTVYGGQIATSETMGAAMCRAVNDWIRAEWLDRDPRLRASIVVPPQDPALAVEEIERCAADKRFVQIMLPAGVEMMLGRKFYWPIYEAAQRHGLPIGLHAGLMYRFAPTSTGWPSHYLQDYASNTHTFEDQLLSLVSQGVFSKFENLKVVLIESGVSWLPGFLWRAVKTWRGVRPEVPWVKESPAEIIRRHVRLTAQPFDAPDDAAILDRLINQIGSDDMLLFATDYPHWQFEESQALPVSLPSRLLEKITIDNPMSTYSRLGETLQ